MSITSALHEALKKHTTKTKEKHETMKSHHNVRHFTVTPADDGSGFAVDTHMKEKKGKDGESTYESPKTSVHKSLASVHKHMKEMCGGVGDTDTGESEGEEVD